MPPSRPPDNVLDHVIVLPEEYDEYRTYPLLLWLHGFGANMHDLTTLPALLDPNAYICVFPDAPLPAPDGEADQRMWYERGGQESPQAVEAALSALDRLVRLVLTRFAASAGRVAVLGFSQGGGMALRYGLPRPDVFAGVAALSSSLARLDELRSTLPAARTQSVFIGHGTADSIVPVDYSRKLEGFLQAEGYQPELHTYPTGHQISPAEIRDLRAWLRGIVGQAQALR